MTRRVDPASGRAGWRRGCALLAGLLAVVVAGCGGGGGGDGGGGGETPAAPVPNSVSLQSDSGDYIGGGRSYRYTTADAVIAVSASGGHLQVAITGDKTWRGEFQLPSALAEFRPGGYSGLLRYPSLDPANGGLSWSGDGRGCNTLQGSFTVDSVSYAADVLTAIDLHFEQHCEGGGPALRGQIHWTATDPTRPAGPASPPATLWQPPAGAMPASGNAVYLQSDAGDYIGQGASRLYTAADSLLSASVSGARLEVGVSGDQGWSGSFQGMNGLTQLQPGYYPGLGRYPFHNPTKGGLDWSGEARGCNTLAGWFVVDSIVYANGQLTAIDLRFEQHCEGGSPALRGRIRWSAGDTTRPPGPVLPLPAGLWSAPAGSTPASGNYAYLQSDAGDYIGAGQTLSYTQANAVIVVNASGGRFSININGAARWTGTFQAMQGLAQLQPGYYGGLQRYPFNNPVRGGLDWSGDGRGCNTLTGWVVIDSVTYVSGAMTAIDLRFEQHCEGAAAALRGQIHWATGDATMPAGPVDPPPAGLWQAASGATPASGNYVYLLSDAGDYIGGGGSNLYTAADTAISVSASGGGLAVAVAGWTGNFQAMNSISQLQPGYYGNLQRYPLHNPAVGGLSWYGLGRGCNTLAGWFIVDAVSYVGGQLTAISLRFEQHCEGGAPALHGQLRWTAAPS